MERKKESSEKVLAALFEGWISRNWFVPSPCHSITGVGSLRRNKQGEFLDGSLFQLPTERFGTSVAPLAVYKSCCHCPVSPHITPLKPIHCDAG